MSKHYFKESKALGSNPQFYRIIYCEWCGVVVWDFNTSDQYTKELQKHAEKPCNANITESYNNALRTKQRARLEALMGDK